MDMAGKARSRHEIMNRRFKVFNVLTKRFRHPLNKHSTCFRAAAVLAQLNVQHGMPIFHVEYCDEGRKLIV